METSVLAAFVASGVALLVGVMSPWIAARTAREALQQQRRIANDDRLWHKRSETYEGLLLWAAKTRTVGTSQDELEDVPLMRQTADDLKMPTPLHAKMTAYASGAVFASARHFLNGQKHFLNLTAVWLETAPTLSPGEQEAYEHRVAEAAQRSDEMAQLVSDDLHGLLPSDDGRVTAPMMSRPLSDVPSALLRSNRWSSTRAKGRPRW